MNNTFKNLFCFFVIEEIWFYIFHRLAHHKSLYKYIHKKHHEYQISFCLASQYCTIIEQIFINILPVVLGPLILKADIHSTMLWLLLVVLSAIHSHSGYAFPYMSNISFHDYHHYNFKGNYGLFGVMDNIFKTNKDYLKIKNN